MYKTTGFAVLYQKVCTALPNGIEHFMTDRLTVIFIKYIFRFIRCVFVRPSMFANFLL